MVNIEKFVDAYLTNSQTYYSKTEYFIVTVQNSVYLYYYFSLEETPKYNFLFLVVYPLNFSRF